MDIMIVQAPSIVRSGTRSTIPLGIAYLASSLKKNGYNAGLVDLQAYPNYRYLEELIEKYKPSVFGVSATTEAFSNAKKIVDIYKKIIPTGIAIVGGVHATFRSEETLRETMFDIVCRGEGEKTIVELARLYLEDYGSLEEIQGISYKKGHDIYHTPDREILMNLDELPFPDREELGIDVYQMPYSIISSRGCSGLCDFCVARIMLKGKYRTRSVENVIDEIKTFDLSKHHNIVFQDSTFTANKKRLRTICQKLDELPKRPTWFCESRVDTLDEDTLEYMKYTGCLGIEFGVESGSDKVLQQIGKNIKRDDVRKTVKMTLDKGLKAFCTIIIGHHSDTKETIKESIDFGNELESYGADLYYNVVTPYPGTPIEQNKEKYGIEIINNNYDEYTGFTAVMNTKHLTYKEIQGLYFDAMVEK